MIINPTSNQPQIGQVATIKTESGYQTVPVILQHGGANNNQVGNAIQIQKQMGGIGQQIIQQVVSVQNAAYNLSGGDKIMTFTVVFPAANTIHASNEPTRSNVFSATIATAASQSDFIDADITAAGRCTNKDHHHFAAADTDNREYWYV